jgi:glycosyltransferase involved in cell wall biosynthesis
MGFSVGNHRPPEVFKKTTLLSFSSPRPPLRFFKQIIGDLTRARRAIKQLLVQVGPPDYVVVTHYLLAPAAGSIRQLKGKPRVYYFHGLRSLDAIKLARPSLKQRILSFLERLALKQSTGIIVPSPSGAACVRRLLEKSAGKAKIYVVPHVLPPIFFSPIAPRQKPTLLKKLQLEEKEKMVLYCGRIAPRKGVENLMIGFATLMRRYPRLKLVIAAPAENIDQGLYNFLQQTIKYFSINERVKWIWDLTTSERAALYRLSQVAVLPSEFEVSSLFFWESLASGLPVVATRVGGMEGILAKIDPKLILANNQPETIAAAIKQVLAPPSGQREKLRLACQAQARIYTARGGGEEFLHVLGKIAGSSW